MTASIDNNHIDTIKLDANGTSLLNIPVEVKDTGINPQKFNPHGVFIATDDVAEITPSVMFSDRTPVAKFIYDLFYKHPELFNTTAETLMYTLNSGKTFQPETYYTAFEQFVATPNEKYISDLRKNTVKNIFWYNSDMIVTWARIIHQSKSVKIFEPVMQKLKKVLNDWCAHKTVYFRGARFVLNDFKPLLYTCSGERIDTLLPYFAYVMTFFIHCCPYAFDDITADSSLFGFYTMVEAHFTKYITALGEDFGMDIIRDMAVSDTQTFEKLLATIPEADWIATIKSMLDASTIVKLRNDEIQKTDGLLETVVSQQNELSEGFVCDAFQETINRLLEIVVQNNPIARVVKQIPGIESIEDKVCMKQLMAITEYMLSGSSGMFNIQILGEKPTADDVRISSNGQLIYKSRYTFNPTVPDVIHKQIGLQSNVMSTINPVSESIGKPFTAGDIHLKLVSGFVREEMDKKFMDSFDETPVEVDYTMLKKQPKKE